MQFNTTAIKATLFSTLVTLSSVAFAGTDHHYRYIPTPTPTPTPYCTPTPLPHDPSAVPEPSAWISLAIGAFAIIALTAWNRAKLAKANS